MAKIELQTPIKSISGKVGGQVFSTNRAGPYLKTKAIPFNEKSTYQGKRRTEFALTQQQWTHLTQAERTSWTNLAKARYGKLTGQNVFCRYSCFWRAAGLPIRKTAPKYYTDPQFFFSSGTYNIATTTLTLVATASPPYYYWLKIELTPPLSQGTTYTKHAYKLIGLQKYAVSTSAPTFNPSTQYLQRYGRAIAYGDNIHCRATTYIPEGQKTNENQFKISITK